MHYSFDSDGKQFRKKYVPAEGSEQKYVYEFRDEQNVAVELPTKAVSHTKTDHLGRKVFDELQLGKGTMNRKFSYYAGEITAAHEQNDKRKSDPETTLVKEIVFDNGRTIQYEYDNEERITKVIDSTDGTYEYTYDAQGQLLTEKKNNAAVNTMTYDKYGNILTKNGKSYTYDATWKDLLTKYNNQTITYDTQGNPTTYLGKTLTWEKGRQLKTYGSNSYSYNNNGIRIEKRENGNIHTYTLDGTNIVKEVVTDAACCPKYTNEYLYDIDGTICGLKYNGTAYYFYKNLQGDVIAIADDTGAVKATYTYDAWGKCTTVSDTSGCNIAEMNPFRYRGYYYDTETDLYYLQSRYYDPEVGRFLNCDFPEMCLYGNYFSYCANSPTVLMDPYGYAQVSVMGHKIDLTAVGFDMDVVACLLLKDHVLNISKEIVRIYGDGKTFKGMSSLRIAQEVLSHAVLYYIGRGIELQTVLLEVVSSINDSIIKTLYKLVSMIMSKFSQYLIDHAERINVNNDETFMRKLIFVIIWSAMPTIDGKCKCTPLSPPVFIPNSLFKLVFLATMLSIRTRMFYLN